MGTWWKLKRRETDALALLHCNTEKLIYFPGNPGIHIHIYILLEHIESLNIALNTQFICILEMSCRLKRNLHETVCRQMQTN